MRKKTPSKKTTQVPWGDDKLNDFTLNNSNDSMLSGIFNQSSYNTQPLSESFTLGNSNNYNPVITLDRILTTQSYMTHGVIQTAIDMPVLDAFRGGIIVKSDELDAEDIQKLQDYLRKSKTIHEVMDTFRWARLYGGAGLIINTPQDAISPLNYKWVDYPELDLKFVAADRWELVLNVMNINQVEDPYNYYGIQLHKSRVLRVIGKEAPSFLRSRLQGWGMSELERMIRDINQYVKANQLLFQLLDEAKIDVWRLMGFNTTILSDMARGKINKRLWYANYAKNYHKAILMDKDDEYEARQLSMSGYGEIMQQIRLGIACALRMPMTKIFGMSASGFNSGEDDIENYNAMVESEIREPAMDILTQVIPLCCQHVFGFVPEHLVIEFKPLRVLGEVEEEEVKTSKQNRYIQLYSSDLLTGQEVMEALKEDQIFIRDTEVLRGEREPEKPMDMGMEDQADTKNKGNEGKPPKKQV